MLKFKHQLVLNEWVLDLILHIKRFLFVSLVVLVLVFLSSLLDLLYNFVSGIVL